MLIFTRLAGFVSFGSLDGSSTIKTCTIEIVRFFQSLSRIVRLCLELSWFVSVVALPSLLFILLFLLVSCVS